jgi:hypothetical protein
MPIQWTSSYWGVLATGMITANTESNYEGWVRIRIGDLDQTIILLPRARHFGGHQWYFVCPVMNRLCSVIWKPPGATRFSSRQTWGRRVAYRSQFLDPDNRAHHGQAKIKMHLIADLDPDEWDLPPKPKWMRWNTYNRYVSRYERYDEILDGGIERLMRMALKLKLL